MAAMLRIGFLGALAVPGLFAPCLALDPSVKVQTRAVEAIDGGRADDAVDLLERATAEDPGAIVLLDLLGKAYLKTGQESLAEEIAERILRAFPDRHPTRLWLGQLLERQGRLREARRHYRILVAAPQAVPEAKELAAIGLARSHLRDREHAEAWRVMAWFLEKNPGGDAVLGSLRSAEPDAGDRELEAARRALETDGSPLPGPEALVPVARALRAEGKRAQAIRVLEKLILARGALEEPAGLLGDLYLETGREADALALAEAWQREAPGSRFGELLLLRALDAQGRDAEAFAEAERLIAEHAREPDWAAPLLEVLIALDQPIEVLEAWRRTGPDPPPAARGALARLFRRAGGRALAEGDPRKAVELIGEAVRLVPGDGAARRELGWAPRYSLRQGIARMAEWMDNAGTEYVA